MRTISTLGDLRGKRVLVRSDFNVPLKDGIITDDGRIRAALPTLKTLTDAGAKVVIMAHLGRPKGKVDPAFSLAPVAKRLAELSGVKVTLASDVVGPSAAETVAALGEGEIALLENVRFDPRETSKVDEEREELAREYAKLGDAFVSDGFGVVHRKQASVYDIAKLLPSAAGLLVLKEIESLSKVTGDPERPYGVVLGGSKVSDKLGVIANLLKKADMLFIGGGMVFTFLAAQGYSVGKSLLEDDQIDTVKGYIAEAAERGVDLVLPVDVIVAPEFAADAPATVVPVDAIPEDQMGLDIGPESREALRRQARRPPRRSPGTAPWASSNSTRSPAAPAPSPKLCPRAPCSPSSAVATPPRPCACSASTRTPSPTFPLAAAPPSSSSRARFCPVSQFWRTDSWHVPPSWPATGR